MSVDVNVFSKGHRKVFRIQIKTEKIYIEYRRGQSVGGMILSNNVTQNLGYYKYTGRLIVFFLGKLKYSRMTACFLC